MNEIKNHVPFSEYLDLPYISAHGLMLIERSPAHYRAAMQAPHRASAKQELGTFTHLAILEPDEYTRRLSLAPDCDKRSKAGKAEWEAYQAALPADAISATPDQIRSVELMRDAVIAQPYARALLDDGIAETTVIADLDGLTVKGRPDWLPRDLPVIVDLKTAADASPRGFSRAAANFCYHLQAALYTDLLYTVTGQNYDFIFLVVENESPHGVALYQLEDDAIEAGRRRYQAALETYRHCLNTDQWPCYATEVLSLELPRWAA